MTQGEELQREFDSVHNQTTNEDKDHLADRHLASVPEFFLTEEYGEKSS